jgi:hypothetical protein
MKKNQLKTFNAFQMLCLLVIGTQNTFANAEEGKNLNGLFGNCTDTFNGRQCTSMIEISYDESKIKIKTYGLNNESSFPITEEYAALIPGNEAYWIEYGEHLIVSKKYIRQQQQQQQHSSHPQQQQCTPQNLCQQQQQPQHSHQTQEQQQPIECQVVTEISLGGNFNGLFYTKNTYCSDGTKSKKYKEYTTLMRQ